MKILLDHCTPAPLARELHGHTVRTAMQEGWRKIKNGELLRRAANAGYDVFITNDQNLPYQQNIAAHEMAVVIIKAERWATIKTRAADVRRAIERARRGRVETVDIRDVQNKGNDR